jgi:hypothetical protein
MAVGETMIRILAGGCVRQTPEVLKAHIQTLLWQTGKYKIDYAWVDDNDNPESSALLAEHAKYLLKADPKPEKAEYAVTNDTHHWTLPMFGWLGREKQKLLDLAKEERYDAVLLVDSDLLLSPDTLDSLWNTQKPVVSGVFWTKWAPQSPPLPQVWLAHPYELQGMGVEAHEFLGAISDRQLQRVAGLGACTLIRANVLDRVKYWPLVDGLPQHGMWQGEDRHFCVTAQRNHVDLWADAWPDIWHCYRPEQRSQIGNMLLAMGPNGGLSDDAVRRGFGPPVLPPRVGDLVSFTLEPLEEPQLAGHVEHVRGRLGAIRMLPQIEEALQSMRAGEEMMLKLRYPMWYPIDVYRNQSRLVRLKLLHAKPFAAHPTLDGEKAVNIGEAFMEAA